LAGRRQVGGDGRGWHRGGRGAGGRAGNGRVASILRCDGPSLTERRDEYSSPRTPVDS